LQWIIALWHWIHGGDPYREGEAAQTTELIARGLVGNLSERKAETELPKDFVEKLDKIGLKIILKSDGKETEIKTTNELHEHFAPGHPISTPLPCIRVIDRHRECFPFALIPGNYRREF
jgi:hypothetical protein